MRDITERLNEWELSALFGAVTMDLARIEEDRRSAIEALRQIRRVREARIRKSRRAGPSGPV